jgi:hypothetical protein
MMAPLPDLITDHISVLTNDMIRFSKLSRKNRRELVTNISTGWTGWRRKGQENGNMYKRRGLFGKA